jgi:hypothetical protein
MDLHQHWWQGQLSQQLKFEAQGDRKKIVPGNLRRPSPWLGPTGLGSDFAQVQQG